MGKTWEEGYDIQKQAKKESEKFNLEAKRILFDEPLTKENYQKVKELLEKEAQVRNRALEKVEKIHREETKNLEEH